MDWTVTVAEVGDTETVTGGVVVFVTLDPPQLERNKMPSVTTTRVFTLERMAFWNVVLVRCILELSLSIVLCP